ncbi:hypothetical protein [Pelosinus propionicus]|uniref:Uncharacterized protein n=1 Tax=Pelosinus propionicus DSM 13327 TaxID=1123291 RepID=A0A1I4QGN0_9FIRM|nr:hypothetical protein [Pelosinus propionicus]SFM39219.1 hypothetical protein SAMN04490355_11003 [Pelosinus propionicus DSM 13327]
MNESVVWKFLGVKKSVENDAERVLQELIELFFVNIESFSGISYLKFNSVEDMIEAAIMQNDKQYGYFWDWFNKHGLLKLRRIGSFKFKNTDEELDFLDYRLYVLEEDSKNQIMQSLIASLADVIGEVHKYCLKKASCLYEDMMAQIIEKCTFSFKTIPLVSSSGIVC